MNEKDLGDSLNQKNEEVNFYRRISLLGVVNFLLIQWFGIRLVRIYENAEPVSWHIIGFILPLTGWWSRYIGKPKALWTTEKL